MQYFKLALGTVAGVALAASASAQTVGIGSTKSGAVAQITATMSKVISSHAEGIQMRSQTMGGTQQYIPVVNAGELEFGISNIPQYSMAYNGTGLSEGNKYDNLRLVATMMLFRVSFITPASKDFKSVAQLKGHPMPSGFKASPLFAAITAGALATEGLSYNDVTQVPIVGLVQSWRALMEGKIDGAIAALGSGFIKQMNATVSGGVKFISIKDSPEALAGLHKHFPKSYFTTVQPSKAYTGVLGPTTMITYDYSLWTHKGLSDEIVYKVTKVMHKYASELKEGGPLWNSYKADANMVKDQGFPYHPGALKYYKEAGLLPKG